jgi:hypothetical protein
MMLLRFVFVFALLMFGPTPAFAKRVALVIGNSAYSHVTALKNPKNDAKLMAKVLKEAGFDVTLLLDLDQRGMKKAMLEFGRKLKDGADARIFYYAGHGIEVDGLNYLVPVDSNMESRDEADLMNVGLNAFLAQMEGSGVSLNIVVLDACRNNPFRSLRAVNKGGLAPVNAPSGTYVAYATAPGSVAVDGEGSNSPFTKALAESIREPGLALETVFKRTREKVKLTSKGEQIPFDSSAITGEFYFKGVIEQELDNSILSISTTELCRKALLENSSLWKENLESEPYVKEAYRRRLAVYDCRLALGLPAAETYAQKLSEFELCAETFDKVEMDWVPAALAAYAIDEVKRRNYTLKQCRKALGINPE